MLRIQRSRHVQCEEIVESENGFIFVVQGQTDIYFVELDLAEWNPSCTCEDHYWRPEILCKHMMHVLIELGITEARLTELDFKPSRLEMYQIYNEATNRMPMLNS